MATQHDLADAFQLRSTPGWQTLLMILQSAGERNPKRARAAMADDGAGDVAVDAPASPSRHSHPSSHDRGRQPDPEERLAKRFAAVRLNEKRPSLGDPS